MNEQKRALAVHDISCVGRCSLTVALPIISACGIECSVLPTVVLSTHTGGFSGFTFRDLTEDIIPIAEHWDKLGLKFDAVYTGFLGTIEQVRLIKGLIEKYRAGGALALVDPVMADDGKLYSIFDAAYVEETKTLVRVADIIAPNITEACLLTGTEYRHAPYSKDYVEELIARLSKLCAGKIVLKGVAFDDRKLGAAAFDPAIGKTEYILGERQAGMYHGTGDIFGSMLISALLNGHDLSAATRFAVDYVIACIQNNRTVDIKYGVDFESPLARFGAAVRK